MNLPTSAAAARNNAEWCDLVCRTHGISGTFGPDTWTVPTRTPLYYPDAVTLAPDALAHAVLDRVDASSGCSVKDSFATLDLGSHGFRVLFEAEWIGRPPQIARAPDELRWQIVEHGRELAEWQAAASATGSSTSSLLPGLLDHTDVVMVAGRQRGRVVAGAILNRGAGVVGLSNLFAGDSELDAAWTGAVDAVAHRFPDDAIVGYESGAALAAAQRCGFASLGSLRVWINDDA